MRKRMNGLATAALLAAGMIITGGVSADASAAAVTTTIHANHASIRIGSTVMVYGRVSPSLPGRVVYLQQRTSGGWKSIAHHRLLARSRYSFTVKPSSTGRKAYRVLKHKSRSGAPRSVSATVWLTVRPRPTSNCTPGYRPCIPPGPDVDCAGGSGNGPRYVDGPVYVTGSDPYDLDRDGDGVACET